MSNYTRNSMNPFEYHKFLMHHYVLKDNQVPEPKKFKTDRDVIYENMKFIWNEEDQPTSWEEKLAKRYYDKLYREYCICDLSRFKENKIANRFRIEKEIISGKGQFICGEKSCNEQIGLKTWEVNFAYMEKGERKNALVKIRLCPNCSDKLNHHSKKREVKRLKKKSKKKSKSSKSHNETEKLSPPTSSRISEEREEDSSQIDSPETSTSRTIQSPIEDENLWKKSNEPETRERDEEFDEYLEDLLL